MSRSSSWSSLVLERRVVNGGGRVLRLLVVPVMACDVGFWLFADGEPHLGGVALREVVRGAIVDSVRTRSRWRSQRAMAGPPSPG